jgi:aconitate hydratase
MLTVAAILKGKTVAPNVDLSIAPGSKQVLEMLSECGALGDMIGAGARILEAACGPCIGMGQSPNSGGVSLRTFNRNFEGRSGTKDAQVYLISPETAAASALAGVLTDPRVLGESILIEQPDAFTVNDNMIIIPDCTGEIRRGPNIKPFPKNTPLADSVEAEAILKVGDNITTDHIMPAGAKILPLRSNIPAISEHCFAVCDEAFPKRAREAGSGIIIGGANYGQGSSREHAALAPLYLGIKAVICKSFARIHKQNLINNGIIPLIFKHEADYDKVSQGDKLMLAGIKRNLDEPMLKNVTTGAEIPLTGGFSEREKAMLLAGGLLNLTKGE